MPEAGGLDIEGLSVGYGAVQALKEVTFSAAPGSISAVLGANGAGKSSLLRAISGIAPVTAGRIRLDSRDITALPPSVRARLGPAWRMPWRGGGCSGN